MRMRGLRNVVALAWTLVIVLVAPAALEAQGSRGVAGGPAADAPAARDVGFVVEGYYRFRWGAEEEFMALYHKNHVPFLERMLAKGSLLEARLEKPREHLPEESRWDLRVTLVYRDAEAATNFGEIGDEDFLAIVGDAESEARFLREEQRRFELLLAHWDVNVRPLETLRLEP